ncbi:M16 family metallopeptidase [Kitasatospora sp. NPDC088783]|uniref:M16 family metallopeptidase n=1 Tax=Kitasatospora sp. NPDC088783 TaxID=3364077 RepID=UPI0037F67C92
MRVEHLRVRGAEAVLVHEPALPLVAVNVRIAAGSRDDPPGRHGLAHVVEHMTFSGTDGRARGEHARLVEGMGGFLNARTSADWTTYLHLVPADALAEVLTLEADRFSQITTGFDETGLAADREIVLRERDERLSPAFGDATATLLAGIHPAPSPYSHLPVGDADHVRAVTVEDCRRFFSRHYVAPNVTMAVLGGFDPDRTRAGATRLLESFRDAPAVRRTAVPGGPRSPKQLRLELDGDHRSRVYLGVHLPPMSDPAAFDLARLGSVVLARGTSGILTRLLVHERPVLQRLSLRTVPRRWDGSLGVLELVPLPGVTADRAVDAFDSAMEALLRHGPEEADITRARAIHLSDRAAEDDSLIHRAANLTLALQMHGVLDRHAGRIEAVDRDGFHRAIGLWHRPDDRVKAVYTR